MRTAPGARTDRPGAKTRPTQRLLLYIARATPNSARAEQNLQQAMDAFPDKGAELNLEIVDVFESPKRAITDGVLVTPTLVGLRPSGRLTMIGDLGDASKLGLLLQGLRDDQKIERMEALVAEKDELLAEGATLAAELNHRIRNNLHLVHQMLTSHLKFESGADGKASVDAIIRRVATLVTIHNQLLGTGLGRTNNLGEYVSSLCESLPALQMSDPDRKIRLMCTAEPVIASLDTVTVIGMVLAETISNSFKHAFPGGIGTINVTLRRSETGEGAILTVGDSGPGFVERPGSKRHGVGLVRRLLEQLGGTAELRSEQSTVWTFRFPVEMAAIKHLSAGSSV